MAGAAILVLAGGTVAAAASPDPSVAAPGASPSAAPASPGASPSVAPIPGLAVGTVSSGGVVERTGATWRMDLPVLAGPLDEAVLTSVNEALAAGGAADLTAFEAGSTIPPAEFDGTDKYDRSFSVALLTPDVLSLRFLTSVYAAGAAHPTAASAGWTFDLRTGRRLALADLFLPDAGYLPVLSRVARHQLRDQLGTDRAARRAIRHGTRPLPRLFASWAMVPDGLEITFSQYQVGSYAVGMPVVVIPWARLTGLLDPAGPAASFLAPAPATSMAPSPSPSVSPTA